MDADDGEPLESSRVSSGRDDDDHPQRPSDDFATTSRINDDAKLYIGHISHRTHRRDLEDLFLKYGRVLRVDIKAPGYGFVTFEDVRDAEDAVRAVNGYNLHGERLLVEFARKPTTTASTCFICGKEGHWVRDCPDNADKELDVRSGKCFHCGQYGHLAKHCRSRDRDGGAPTRRPRSRSRSPAYGRGGGRHGSPPRRRSPSPRRDYRGPDYRNGSPRRDGYREPPRRRYDSPPPPPPGRGYDRGDNYNSKRPRSPPRGRY
ncbi:hypothetical protein HDU85_002532 [Gaertneriomyces sp. JEL0708]|nr:hypothetical protein HDU85_002532 [Gaertneriomyces sp. JEL0708]